MNNYDCSALRAVTGETIRPGGYRLTKRAVDFCKLASADRLLDVGCGTGASVEFLIKEYNLAAVGIDPNLKMLELGTKRCGGLPILQGRAESLDFEAQTVDAILSECSLSHYVNIHQALDEFSRVLVDDGWLIVSDLYLRRDDLPQEDVAGSVVQSKFMDSGTIHTYLSEHGFEIITWEDHTDELQQLSIDLIMKYGSVKNFWEKDCHCCTDCSFSSMAVGNKHCGFSKNNIGFKLGYFLLIAKKR